MESADGQRGRDGGSQRRSPLDVIMSQIRRKRAASDRKRAASNRKPLGRFLSYTSDRPGIPEDEEDRGPRSASVDSERHIGWGRVCVFLQQLGKKGDSRSLSLTHCDLTATDLLELGEALGCVPLLEVLDLSWNGGVGGVALQSLLGKLQPPLKELHLVACQLTAADAAALGGSVAVLPRLCVLDVSCNPQLAQEVDGDGFRALAASLSHAASLTALRLQACGLTADDLDALGGSFRYLPSLRELDLSCNKHLSGGLSRLTFHLAHVSHLEILDLHLCCLTPGDLRALVQVLPSLTALTELDVSSNKEAGDVVPPLVSALPLTQMRRLPLNGCSLNDASFSALALAVPFLRAVDVSWCKVVGGRLSLLLDALQPSIILELRLSSCELTTDDLRHLAAASGRGRLSSLRVLDLSYNGSTGDVGRSALFAAGGLGSLEDLDLSLRPSTSAPCSAWLPALLRALPGMSALARLALQRWTAGSQERRQLSSKLRKRSVLLEWDTDEKEAAGSTEGPEEGQPEE
ncbi:leucine-rich repeat-containing protein 31 isoform X4 [Brachyistius frenatus]|uniref:leucine-rich repeat-containing protein 31 isoform X4 n=1 Tax=Brachyistius frenatus TaxID=100188 RepID=UPI0037E84C3A